jgi:hypothetical protein
MTSSIFESPDREQSILDRIKEGMAVYDANKQKLGKVDFVHLGAVSPQAADRGDVVEAAPLDDEPVTFAAIVMQVFEKDNLPKELRQRLAEYGFVHVDVPGLLAHDRYILPDQITQVTTDGVVLRDTRQELIKGRDK